MNMLNQLSHHSLPVVLLIDDDMVSREVTATLLTLSGFTVHTAESGDLALELLKGEDCAPSAILTDVQMPGLSGVPLIQELRKACEGASVYVISGSQPPEEIVAAADGLLLKPFDGEGLWRFLERGGQEQRKASYLDPDVPEVSATVLNKMRQMMSEKAVRDIYTAMVTDLDKRLDLLGQALGRRDREEVRRIGHAIKGGCSMAGAMQAARLGALLEAQTIEQDNHLDNSRALLADLRTAASGLHRILEGELPA